MKYNILKIAGLLMLSSTIVVASGYRIPEQSSRSVALSGAYIANANGADATYYNPANMSFNTNKTMSEFSLMSIKLGSINYKDNISNLKDGESKKESFIVPTIFITTEDYNNNDVRYGFSLTAPGGLSKRWDSIIQKISAEEFSLQVVELNPTVSYKLKSNFAIAVGFRVIISEGIVKSDGLGTAKPIKRDMKGDGLDYGYNLALAYKPDNKSNISATYRSKVILETEGDAKLYYNSIIPSYNGSSSVAIPLPAVLTLAYSYDFDTTSIELTYDKTYWSAYKELDFKYSTTIGALTPYFDDPKAKEWKDTNAYRIGITHKYSTNLTFMAGYAIDENPIPEKNIGYDLPDSDAKLYSIGCDYKLDNKSSLGFGYLLDVKESRKVTSSTIDGEFTNAKATLISLAYRTTF